MPTTLLSTQAARRFIFGGGVTNLTPRRVVFGPGSVREIKAELDLLEAKRPLVLSTPGRRSMAESIAAAIGPDCAGVLAEAVSQVPIELTQRGREQVGDAGADCVVAIGGGASTGLAKGIALETGIPYIAIPTTYSGSEMTGYCGITIAGVKQMFESTNMIARTVIYDAELTTNLSLESSAASALNALAHCVESVYVPTASPVHALAGIEGARILARSLPGVLTNPEDIDARNEALYGAYLGGVALSGGFALQHTLAHVLGGSFAIEHGLSHAIILPHVTAYNMRFAQTQLKQIGEAIGSNDAAEGLFKLMQRLELPTGLHQLGIQEDQLPSIAKITIDTYRGLNPGPVTYDAVLSILQSAYHGNGPHRTNGSSAGSHPQAPQIPVVPAPDNNDAPAAPAKKTD